MSRIATIAKVEEGFSPSVQYDYFVLSKGVEDRAYTLVDRFSSSFSYLETLIFDVRNNKEGLRPSESLRYNAIDAILIDKGYSNTQIIPVEDTNLGSKINELHLPRMESIALDISSMSFWEIGDLVYYFIVVLGVEKLDIFYTEPDIYKYELSDLTNYNYGVYPVSVNYHPSYKSTNTNQSDEVFVALLGFQKNCLKLIKDLYEPSESFAINGFPSFYPKAKDISLVNNRDLLLEVELSHRLSSDARNPFLCFNLLSDISKQNKGRFMTICPMGSKPMMLGAFIYAIKNSEATQIIYPYNESVRITSHGVGQTYCFHFEKSYFE